MNSELIQALEDSREEFLTSAAGVTEEQARVSPAPGRWSVLECAEHIVTVEGRFVGWLQNPEATPAPAEDKQKEALLAQRIAERSTKNQAPEAAQPKGRFGSLAEALAEFKTVRAASIQFAQEQGSGLYSISTKHPALGPINGTELMVMMAAHTRRHAGQVREIREQLS